MPSPEEQRKYQEDLAKYNNQMQANKDADNKISALESANKELNEEIKELEKAKKNCQNAKDKATSNLSKLKKVSDASSFKGQIQGKYEQSQKNDLENELKKFSNSIEGGSNSVVKEINDEIKKKRKEISDNNDQINQTKNSKTTPVKPTEPK